MDILVIGGTGLISTSITHQLVGRGHDVTLYNRGRSETRFPDKVKRITGDRGDFAAFERQMRAGRSNRGKPIPPTTVSSPSGNACAGK